MIIRIDTSAAIDVNRVVALYDTPNRDNVVGQRGTKIRLEGLETPIFTDLPLEEVITKINAARLDWVLSTEFEGVDRP